MKLISFIRIEFKKIKRSKIIPILLLAMLVLWFPSLINVEMNFDMETGITPENSLLIQGLLAMTGFIYPASMIVITLLINQNEHSNSGILKMLSLPVNPKYLSLAKFVVLLVLAALQVLLSVTIYYMVAFLASQATDYNFILSPLAVLKEVSLIYVTSIPMLAFYWMISVFFQTPIFAIGIGLASIVPSVLMINTRVWYLYPICYPYYIVASRYGKLASNFPNFDITFIPWIPAACFITVLCLGIACVQFGKKERR